MSERKLNATSARLTEVDSQGASQAMLHATGLTDADLKKPQIGIASVWYDGNPCNMHLGDLATKVREAVRADGMVGMRFNTVGVSDGISMGTDGMSYSLPSRELIADSIETAMGAHFYDALVAVPGCDKNMPGCLIAMGRLNRPSLMVYGGTIRAGERVDASGNKVKLDVVSAFQSYGEKLAGTIDEATRKDIVAKACPGAGACGGMYTANTMASAIEALGISGPDQPWAEMSHEDREWYMVGKVLPIMKELFAEHDEERYAGSYGCETCHGENMQEVEYEMPPASSYKVPAPGSEAWTSMEGIFGDTVTFMKETVTPTMGTLLGKDDYTCFHCHPRAGE